MTVEKAAGLVGLSQSKLTQIELARQVATRDEVIRLFDAYGGGSEKEREELLALVRGARSKEWWESIHSLPPKFGVYLGLESVAEALTAYDPILVHGLLQTQDYARAVIQAGNSDLMGHEIAQLVETRMRRQATVLHREDSPPLKLWCIMDEAVLRHEVGGRKTMHAQIEYLIEETARANVTIQLMPDRLGAHAGMAGSLTIFDFEASGRPVAYVDGHAGNLFMERDEDLRRTRRVMDRIIATALGPEQSLALIRDISEGMRP